MTSKAARLNLRGTPPERGSGESGDRALAGEPVSWKGLWLSIALAGVAFAPAIVYTVRAWWTQPECSHGFLMPLVALWLLRERREKIAALRGGSSLFAIPLMIVCMLAMPIAELDFMVSVAPFAFLGALGAVLLAHVGWRGLGVFLPALVALALSCRLPGAVSQGLTLPLREISAQLAVGLLHISGIPTFLDGNMIHLQGADSLWVAEACSGIRSFVSLLSLAIVACMLWKRHWALKVVVILAAAPIAVLANGLRIWLTGWLSVHAGPEAAAGAFHFFEGFALFALAGLLLLGFVGLLGLMFPRASR